MTQPEDGLKRHIGIFDVGHQVIAVEHKIIRVGQRLPNFKPRRQFFKRVSQHVGHARRMVKRLGDQVEVPNAHVSAFNGQRKASFTFKQLLFL